MSKDVLNVVHQSVGFILLSFFLLLFGSVSHALPFVIVQKAGTTLPTTLNNNGTANVFYTVSNNTASQRNNNYVKYLPSYVSQVTSNVVYSDTCGVTFNLAPRGQPGSSCTLQLVVSGPVNATSPQQSNHLFVCFPGGKSCAGTPVPLNVSINNWINTGLTGANFIADITSLGENLYAGGLETVGTSPFDYPAGQLWALTSSWVPQYTSPLAYLRVTSLIPNANNTGLYTSEGNAGYGEVDSFTPGSSAPVAVGSISTATVPASTVNDLSLGLSNVLYAAGATTSFPARGEVWSWNGSTWTATNFSAQGQGAAYWLTYVPTAGTTQGLYVAASNPVGSNSVVYFYTGSTWQNTTLPVNLMNTVLGLNVDASGNLYAEGSTTSSGATQGSILVYQGGGNWSSVAAPSDSQALAILAFSPTGVMYAGGTNTQGQGAVWYANGDGSWVNTQLIGSSGITTLAFNSAGVLYAGGTEINSQTASVWALKG